LSPSKDIISFHSINCSPSPFYADFLRLLSQFNIKSIGGCPNRVLFLQCALHHSRHSSSLGTLLIFDHTSTSTPFLRNQPMLRVSNEWLMT
jgi:hypothetical protein